MTVTSPIKHEPRFPAPILWLFIVSTVAVLERLLIFFFYQPVSYSDTPSYRRLADSVLHGFVNYDGTRTPGYPVFLALVGNDRHVWLVQLLLGLFSTLLLFYVAWKLTDKAWFGGLIALAHTLNLGQLLFESNLLTESLTTFLLFLTMTGVLIWLFHPKTRNMWMAFFLGLSSSATLLVRPLFIYLPFLVLFFLWFTPREVTDARPAEGKKGIENHGHAHPKHSPAWLIAVSLLLPVILLVGGWLSFIHSQFGDWSLTTMTGYHLVQHTGNFFEYVPDEYASVRDTYIRYRDEHIAQYGTQTNTIWEAIPEMSRVSGYSFYELSRVLTRISIQLIVKHPFLFAKSVASGWWLFWRTSVYWSAEAWKVPWMTGAIGIAILGQRAILFLINMLFIITSLFYMLRKGLLAIRSKPDQWHLFISQPAQASFSWFILANIWLTSILQSLLDHGDNPRFLIPLQSVVVLWVAVFILQLARRKQHQPAPE